MLEKLLERRQEMLRMKSTGLSLAKIIEDLSVKYEISVRGLYKDWAGRARWIKAILSMEDPEVFFLDVLATQKQIYNRAYMEYLKADNSNARIGALRLLRDLNKDLYEMVSLHDLIIRVDRIEEKTQGGNVNE